VVEGAFVEIIPIHGLLWRAIHGCLERDDRRTKRQHTARKNVTPPERKRMVLDGRLFRGTPAVQEG
jgi:hypothetical protein